MTLCASASCGRFMLTPLRRSVRLVELYLGAVKKSMQSGVHYRFAEIHSSKPTYDHAHGNCGFLLWHRKFLMGYENMLRDQGPQFKGVTVPYWNYFEDHDSHLSTSNPCNSWAECSPFLSDFGGASVSAPQMTQTIARATVTGSCVSSGVAGSACTLPNGQKDTSGKCQECIVRGNWFQPYNFLPITKGQITAAIRYVDEAADKNVSQAHDILRQKLEHGFHADVHNSLDGIMKTSASPFDPVFYGHHGMIDMIQFVYNRCQHGSTSAHTQKDDRSMYNVFSTCSFTATTGKVSATATVTADTPILINYNGKPADQDPVLGKYFTGIGSTYRDFQNAESLKGDGNSYRYLVDQYFEKILKGQGIECPDYIYSSSSYSNSTVSKKHRRHHHRKSQNKEEYASDDEVLYDSNPVAEMITTLTACGQELKERECSLSHVGVAIQQSILECEATRQRSCLEFEDFTPEFRATFNLPADYQPHCYTLLNAVKEGHVTLDLSETCRYEFGRMTGTRLTEEYFGKPLNCTVQNFTSTTPTETYSESAYSHHHHQRTHVSIKVHAST